MKLDQEGVSILQKFGEYLEVLSGKVLSGVFAHNRLYMNMRMNKMSN